ncbi:hypothetical protein SBA6_120016 [Candidatus Sulfopaludibacter sp. SbA6]|nr:hypothetical protein SBA6_120016 [Candidatus Sulfopaludibacter sp. SbA6]
MCGVLNGCLAALRQTGLLLKSDPVLPSVTTLVAGEAIRGSWWGHPAGSLIFQTLQQLAEHREVLFVKLVAGKDTLVHRSLWPEVYAIGSAGEAWQRAGLSAAARALEKQVAKAGVVQASGAVAKELELRLLVRCEQFHTDAGHHSKGLEAWPRWADRVGLDARRVTPSEAKAAFEAILPAAKFPWQVDRRAATAPSRSRLGT